MNLFRGRADQTSRVTGCGRFHELFVSPGNFTLFLFNSWSIGCMIVHVYIRRSAEQQS
jgi:hypothetical protein